MRAAHEMPWPPTPGEPYVVTDLMGEYTEVVEPGALDGAERIPGHRTFRVGEEEWNDDFTHRRILKLAAITAD